MYNNNKIVNKNAVNCFCTVFIVSEVKMDENFEKTPEEAADDVVELDEDEDDLNINEIMHLDEILGKSSAEKVKLLDYERQMFQDCVYNDGLVICGK